MSKFNYKIIKDGNDLLLLIPHIKNYTVTETFIELNNLKLKYNVGKTLVIPKLKNENILELNSRNAIWIIEYNRIDESLVSSYRVKLFNKNK